MKGRSHLGTQCKSPMPNLVVLLGLTLLLVGCATDTVRITYSSEPQGATIYTVDSIISLGRAPVVRTYPLAMLGEPDTNGCVVIQGVEAVWDSGATARVGGFRVCDTQQQLMRHVALPRPGGYPGLDIDLEAAARRGRELNREREFDRIGIVEPPRGNPAGNR